ncbi:MAG: DUF3108 domain-containing protein [Planctomycetes bacterium]|nr:DUF3108 domain-containing protein [Planctomycetota bacterium]
MTRHPARALAVGLALVGAALAPLGGQDAPPSPGLHPFVRAGERLVYRVRVWKGMRFIGADVGQASFDTRVEPGEGASGETPGAVVFEARARGGYLGFGVDATMRSSCLPEDLRPSSYRFSQRGSELVETRIDFEGGEAVHRRLVHCGGKGCALAAHQVEREYRRFWVGPRYKVREHCDGVACAAEPHGQWVELARHPLAGPAFDVLTAMYAARSFDPTVGAPRRDLHVITGTASWMYHIGVDEEADLTVGAGTFDAVRLDMPHELVSGTGAFMGPFGLNKLLALWVDRRTRVPIRIAGVLDMGVDVNVEITLDALE